MYISDLAHSNQNLQQKLEALYGLRADKSPALGFRTEYLDLLAAFGNPHLDLPPTIHVAGTNGKGSTIAYLRAILEAAGYRVHVYTSPHLVRFNERIVLAGSGIKDDYLESLIDQALFYNEDRAISFFEVTTAIAFKAFADTPADFLLLETGLGGRLDCTNVISSPAATVITSIGLDHQEFLGDTLDKIAAEKAGIMKAGTPCISGAGDMAVISDRAKALRVDLYSPDTNEEFYPPDMPDFQQGNLNIALKTIDVLSKENGLNISDKLLKSGINKFHWPARLQSIACGISQDWQVYLDGGHNADAGHVLARQIKKWKAQNPEENIHVVIGMMGHKDHAAFLNPVCAVADHINFVDIPHEPKAASSGNLKEISSQNNAKCYPDYREALMDVANNYASGIILICGSLYLAGHVLKSEALM